MFPSCEHSNEGVVVISVYLDQVVRWPYPQGLQRKTTKLFPFIIIMLAMQQNSYQAYRRFHTDLNKYERLATKSFFCFFVVHNPRDLRQ